MKINRNQTELDAMLELAIKQVTDADLKPAPIDPELYLTRAKKQFGRCESIPGGYAISISKFFKDNPTEEVMDTLVHEVLHTLPGCQNHGPNWKNAAAIVNRKYGYDITRTGTEVMANLTTDDIKAMRRYTVECLGCGNQLHRERKSKLITQTYLYTCGKCGGELKLKEDN